MVFSIKDLVRKVIGDDLYHHCKDAKSNSGTNSQSGDYCMYVTFKDEQAALGAYKKFYEWVETFEFGHPRYPNTTDVGPLPMHHFQKWCTPKESSW